MVDWSAGNYEKTAAELEPVAQVIIEQAEPLLGKAVMDLACGTGNAALLAAARGGRVIGVDGASRLLEVTRERARVRRLDVDVRHGDLLDLPLADDEVELVISVFGLIFASEPALALGEVRRVLRSGGRVLMSAWIPAGPIDAMLGAVGHIVGRVTQSPAPRRFPWSDAIALRRLAGETGLMLVASRAGELAIRDTSPEAYLLASQEHPMALAMQSVIQHAGVEHEVREAMAAVLREANEDPEAFLVHSPYVVHELRAD